MRFGTRLVGGVELPPCRAGIHFLIAAHTTVDLCVVPFRRWVLSIPLDNTAYSVMQLHSANPHEYVAVRHMCSFATDLPVDIAFKGLVVYWLFRTCT